MLPVSTLGNRATQDDKTVMRREAWRFRYLVLTALVSGHVEMHDNDYCISLSLRLLPY